MTGGRRRCCFKAPISITSGAGIFLWLPAIRGSERSPLPGTTRRKRFTAATCSGWRTPTTTRNLWRGKANLRPAAGTRGRVLVFKPAGGVGAQGMGRGGGGGVTKRKFLTKEYLKAQQRAPLRRSS